MTTSSDRADLLPCPFCGDHEELRVEADKACDCPCYWWVVCGACGGRMIAEGEGSAIAAWNARATPTITRELVEALEEAQPYVEAYCQEHGATGTPLQAKLVALLAKIDAALARAKALDAEEQP